MNNKPVAWVDEQGKVFSNPLSAMRNQAQGNVIPLYTHPAELTDEEIHKIAQEQFHAGLGINPLDFAKAILRKAQEK